MLPVFTKHSVGIRVHERRVYHPPTARSTIPDLQGKLHHYELVFPHRPSGLTSCIAGTLPLYRTGLLRHRRLHRTLRHQRSPLPHRHPDHPGRRSCGHHAAVQPLQRHPLEPDRPLPAAPFHHHPADPLNLIEKSHGGYANKLYGATVLWIVGLVVIGLNIALLVDIARG